MAAIYVNVHLKFLQREKFCAFASFDVDGLVAARCDDVFSSSCSTLALERRPRVSMNSVLSVLSISGSFPSLLATLALIYGVTKVSLVTSSKHFRIIVTVSTCDATSAVSSSSLQPLALALASSASLYTTCRAPKEVISDYRLAIPCLGYGMDACVTSA